ncbi:MAG: 5-(carboxyamino)imidazole ribonucleotide mutase [Lentimicrobium sp.]
MNPLVSIIMGSTSDWGVMEEAANFLNEMQIPFEVNALSAHRTPEKVESFSRMVQQRGIRVIIAGAGMAAHLPGIIAAYTTLPVIGVPIKSSLAGLDAMLSIIQMPPGIPVATVGINAARNAAILATQIIALSDTNIAQRLFSFKESLKEKVILANEELKKINYPYKVD